MGISLTAVWCEFCKRTLGTVELLSQQLLRQHRQGTESRLEQIWCRMTEKLREEEQGTDSAAGEGQGSTSGGLEHTHSRVVDVPGVQIGPYMSSHLSPT